MDIGVQFSKHFRPFPCIALMLIFTAVSYAGELQVRLLILCYQIECCIDEWGTGTRVDIHFTADAYQGIYEEHLHVFNNFADYCRKNGCPDLVQTLLERLHDHGW